MTKERVNNWATYLVGEYYEGEVLCLGNLTKKQLIEAIMRAGGDVVRQPDGKLVFVGASEDMPDYKFYELEHIRNAGWRIEGKNKFFASKEDAFGAIKS